MPPGADAEALVEHLTRELRRELSGERFVLFGSPIAGLLPLAAQLRSLGGEAVFLLGPSAGAGRMPEDTPWASLGIRGRNLMDEFWRAEARYPEPPASITRALDRADPEGSARAVAVFTMTHVPHVAGRRRFGLRPKRWLPLEDKTRIDALWRALGVPHAPVRHVAPEFDALWRAAERVDRGDGTVWAADASGGIHGGAIGTRWVVDRAGGRRAARSFARMCHRVRVMPFLRGRPCSIHGMVLPGHTLVLRPVEMVTLRPPGTASLHYSGVGSFWDPPDRDRKRMRTLARRTGEALRERVGFRGSFTIDGVLTDEGFLPTEVNARQGGALATVTSGVPQLPVSWLSLAAIEGLPIDWRPRWFERVLLDVCDRYRAGRGLAVVKGRREGSEVVGLTRGVRGLRRARRASEIESHLVVGPNSLGTYVGWHPDPRTIPAGPAFAPRVAEAFAWADRRLGVGIGPLEAL